MLVTFHDAARYCELSESGLRQRMLHFPGFPEPVTGELFDLEQVKQWAATACPWLQRSAERRRNRRGIIFY